MSSSTFSPHANSTMSDTINDTYVTAIEDSPTQYLSVLESTNEEAELEEEAISLDNLNNMTVTVEHMNVDEDNDVIVEQQQYEEEDGEEEGLNLVCSDDGGGADMTLTGSMGGEEASNGQIVVFTLEGSDDYYGVQVAQDEDGNFHRYQFQFRKSDDGQLEAIPESIQLLPDEDDQPVQLQQHQLVENSTEDHEDRDGVMILGDSESVNVQNMMEIQQQEQRPQHQQYQDDFQAAIIHETEIHLTVGKEEETEAEDEPEDQDEEDIEIEQKVLPEQQPQGLQTASSGLRIFIGEDQQHCGERILPDDDNDDAYEDHNENADLEGEEESRQNNQHYYHGDGYVVETEEHQRQGLEQQPNPKAEICEEQDEDEDQEQVNDDAAAETTVDVKPTGFMHMKQELIDENTSEEFARERESFVANEHNLILNEALTTNDNRQEDDDHYQGEEGRSENNDVIGLSQPQQDHVQYDIQYEQEEQQDGAADTEEEEEEGGDQDRDPDEVYERLDDSSEADQDQDQEDGCLGELDDREGNFVGVQTEQPQLQQSQEEEEEEFVFDINMEINEPICEITSSEDHNNCQTSSNNSDRDLGQLRHLTIHSNSSGETCGGGEDEHEEGEDDYDNIDDDENSAEIGERNLENRKMDEEMEEEAIPETTQDFCQGLVAEEDQQFQFVHAAIEAATLDPDSRHGDDNDYFRDDQQMAHNLGKGVFSAVTTDRLNNVMIAKKIVNHEKPMMVMGERTYQYLQQQQQQQQQQQNTKLEDSKLLLYFVHPEKENVDALSFNAGNNNMNNNNNNAPHAVYGKASKTNPRSILKSSHLSGAGSIAQQIPQQQHQQQPKLLPQAAQKHHLLPNAAKKPILLQDLAVASAYQEKLAAKRFARGKEATQARILQNFINRTTIPQAPVRTKRLPRKQKIKPVERLGGEEIVVQEVMISSEGFVEAVCTSGGGRMNKRSKQRVTEYVELTDSEEEEYVATSKRSRKHDSTKTITISDTEDETTRDSVIDLEAPPEDTTGSSGSSPPTDGSTTLGTRSGTKRRRGRPPKKSTNGKKASSAAAAMVTGSSGQAISPVEDSGMGSDTASNALFAKTEIPCTVCSKTFASPNSLKTHLQHHTLENSMKNVNNAAATDSTGSKSLNASDKYKCEKCGAAFKNSALLTRHACPTSTAASGKVDGDIKKKNIDTNSGMVKCAVCKKSFPNTTTLNVHKRVHVKEMLAKQTLAHMTPPKNKKLTQQLPKSPTAASKTTVQAVTTTSSGMIKCTMCKKTFPNMTTLSVHKRVHAKEMLAKQTLLAQTATPPKSRKSQPQTQPQQNSTSPSSSSNEPKKVHSRESGNAVFKLPAVRRKIVSSAGAAGGSSSDNASLFRCNVCRKVCPSQQTLTAHQKIHKELTCSTCGKCFSNRLILAQHLRSGNCSGGGVSKSSNRSPTNSSNKVKRRSPRSKSSSCLTDVMGGGCHGDADNNPETTLNNTTRASTSFVRRSKTSMSLTNDLNCDLCSMQFSSKIALKSHKLVKHPTTEGSAASTPSKNSTGNSANKRTSSIRRQHCGIPATSRFARAFQGIRELNFDDDDDHQ